MNKKIVLVFFFLIFSVFLTYYVYKDNTVPFQEFCDNIDNKLSEIEIINFKYYRDIRSGYSFTQDTIHADINFNLFNKVIIYDRHKDRYYILDDLPVGFYKDFLKVKRICKDLYVYDLFKDSLNKKIEFIFNIKYIKTETIPKWDKKLDNKKESYDGYLVYDINNELEKNINYYKIKDKWYFEYHERRPN